MPLTELNLRPFGIPGVLKSGFDFDAIDPEELNSGKRNLTISGNTSSFRMKGVTYTVLNSLGEGTYGKSYLCMSPDGSQYAIKYIKGKLDSKEEFVAFLKECIIQILVAEVSKAQPTGPYAPRLYEVAFDPVTSEGFIRSEQMRNKMDNLVAVLSPAENDLMIPDALKQLATALKFLFKELKFNHRDLKGDNIMYVRSPDGMFRWWRFIDFGMSCVTFDGMKISGSSWFDDSHSCFKEDRDLSQLMFAMYQYYAPYISDRLDARLRKILMANIKSGKGHKCSMYKFCPRDRLIKWANIYDFVDRPNVEIPAGNPDFVIANMKRFTDGNAFIPPAPVCPEGMIVNPRTNRCVAIAGPVGHDVLAAAAAKPCPHGKILNPETGRCVSITGAIGRKLVPAAPAVPAEAAGAAAAAAEANPCPPNKILNPATRRCVKRDGKVGKGLAFAHAHGGTRKQRRR